MDAILLVLLIYFLSMLAYLNGLASFLVFVDTYLSPTKKAIYLAAIWLAPYFGGALILFFVRDHSPELIQRLWIPWPIRAAIENKHFGGDPQRSETENIDSLAPVGYVGDNEND